MVLHRKTNFSLVNRWFKENHLFAREKLVFLCKTIFLRGKNKKTSFSTSPPHSLKKVAFLFFWFCLVPLSGQNRSALHVAVQWTVLVRSRTCQHAWRLVGFGQSYINLSNSIPIPINVKGFLLSL